MVQKRSFLVQATLLVLALLLVAGMAGCTKGKSSEATKEIRIAQQPVSETLPTWTAVEDGLDKEKDVKLNIIYFDSGMPMIEALPANQWDIGAIGTPPMLMAALRYDAYLIGIANDYAASEKIYVRADSPLLANRGADATFPNIYGTSDEIKGKTILTTTVSTAHYVVSGYLKALGLKDSDVNIMNAEQSQAITAFESGTGDMVALWPPFTHTAERKGWKAISTGSDVDLAVPAVIIANKKFADEHPDLVVKYLDMYFKGIDRVRAFQEGGDQGLLEQAKSMYKDWAGLNMSDDEVALNISENPVYTLEEQVRLFDDANGTSQVELWMQDIINFLGDQGKIKPEERDELLKGEFIKGDFIKQLAEERGLTK